MSYGGIKWPREELLYLLCGPSQCPLQGMRKSLLSGHLLWPQLGNCSYASGRNLAGGTFLGFLCWSVHNCGQEWLTYSSQFYSAAKLLAIENNPSQQPCNGLRFQVLKSELIAIKASEKLLMYCKDEEWLVKLFKSAHDLSSSVLFSLSYLGL